MTAAYLAAECNNEQFTIPRLDPGNRYTGPSESDMCRCNSVFYSLISACAGCQKSPWIPYNEWYANCTSVAPVSTFPRTITNDTLVPAWAFLSVANSQRWDNVTSCDFGGNPESNGNARPSFAPQFSVRDAVHVGLAVGLAIGITILIVGIVGAGAWYLLRRYRRRRLLGTHHRSSSAEHLTAEQEHGTYEAVPLTPESDMRLYDPSDPSTYPDPKVLPPGAMNPSSSSENLTTVALGLASPQWPKQYPTDYSGLPEPEP
ncbi:hypothetical protein BC826DRAFT_397276 [Russula brevipes]|nr:hypothetical protein BC826DRAFT_397276 [Russula brevipes]